ncbi:ABC transporter ATP-binding protein [Robertmurraya korlensis]|uniref:ABC transporter ATP-binding protein n=1 Tax=Robertmurraya korlensis TaxID=519977 RepID=UPI0008262C28|nr:ABC transporter ATP-binding protein [Robertmurraya korlensis]
MTGIVQLQNVTKTIKGKTIIDSLSFEVNKGEVFGFLGPNGAGKTTTIRMMVGLIGITSGDIKIGGNSIQSNFEQAVSRIGAIVENPEMYKFLTGYENLIHFARLSNKVDKQKIDEVVKLVNLSDRIHDKVKNYSLGMRQRLGVAQALLHDPEVLILDEPTNGLDPAGIREMRDHLKMLTREKGLAVIVSSHLLSEMEMMCDRIAILQKGKLVDVQTIQDFKNGVDHVVEFNVVPVDKALVIIQALGIPARKGEAGLTCKINKEDIPSIVKSLTTENINVYGIKEVTKSLEERFLEVTEEREVSLYA